MTRPMSLPMLCALAVLAVLLVVPPAAAATPASGETCSPMRGRGETCSAMSDCGPNLSCLDGVCDTARAGGDCTTTDDCPPDERMVCHESKCTWMSSGEEPCTSAATCITGSCVAGVCEPVPEGGACDPLAIANPCGITSWCNTSSVCETARPQGASCADSIECMFDGSCSWQVGSKACYGAATCSGARGAQVCVAVVSKAIGEACGPFRMGGCNTRAGLYCDVPLYTDMAATAVADIPQGVCRTGEPDGSACYWHHECQGTCKCNGTDAAEGGTCTAGFDFGQSGRCLLDQVATMLCAARQPCGPSFVMNFHTLRLPFLEFSESCMALCEVERHTWECCLRHSNGFDIDYACPGDDDDDDDDSASPAAAQAPPLGMFVAGAALVLGHLLTRH